MALKALDIQTSLNLDTSFDIPGMLSDSGKISLSDIIAATIGENEASGNADSKNNIALVPDFTENSNSCDSNSRQFYPDDVRPNDIYIKSDISGLFSENSNNACDSFSVGPVLNDKAKHSNVNINLTDIKTEITTQVGTQNPKLDDAEDAFFSFFNDKFGEYKEMTTTDQQVVPKLEDRQTCDKESDVKDQSTASFDSDLEDSVTFVDPGDLFPWTDNSDQKPDIQPKAKRSRFSDIDSSTCPFPVSIKSEKRLSFDMNSENSMPSDLNKNFNSPFVTPMNSRSRSLSEACNREEFSPLGESRFNISLNSLLGSPMSDSPLSNNPFFNDLKSVLALDCKKMDYPVKLFETLSDKQHQDVYARERNLQAKFSSLQSKYPEEIRKLSSFYRCQSAEIETERFKHLHGGDTIPASYRNYLNDYYDDQLHRIMNRVEKSVKILSDAKQETVLPPNRIYLKSRPLLSRKAVTMMDEWYTRNFEHPYPSQSAIDALAKAGEITVEQVKKWFANKRNRSKNTKPQPEIANMKRKRQYSSRW